MVPDRRQYGRWTYRDGGGSRNCRSVRFMLRCPESADFVYIVLGAHVIETVEEPCIQARLHTAGAEHVLHCRVRIQQ